MQPGDPKKGNKEQKEFEDLMAMFDKMKSKFDKIEDTLKQLDESIRELQEKLKDLDAKTKELANRQGRPGSVAPAPAPPQAVPQPAFQAPWVPALQVSNWVMYRPPPSLSGLLSSPMPSLLGAPPCSYYTVFPASAPRVRVVAVPGTPNMALVSEVMPSPGVTDLAIAPGGSLIFRALCNVMGATKVSDFTLCGAFSYIIDSVLRCDLDKDVTCMTEEGESKSVRLRDLVLSIVQQVARSGIPGAVELIFPPLSEQTAVTVAALAHTGVLVGFRLRDLVSASKLKAAQRVDTMAREQGIWDGGIYAIDAERRGVVRFLSFEELGGNLGNATVYARVGLDRDLFPRLGGEQQVSVPGFPSTYRELLKVTGVTLNMSFDMVMERIANAWTIVETSLKSWSCSNITKAAQTPVAIGLYNYEHLKDGLRTALFSAL